MKLESALLAAALALVAASTSTAFAVEEQHADAPARGTPVGVPLLNSDPSAAKTGQAKVVKTGKSEAKKPIKNSGHMEDKTTTPRVMLLRDWEELFGHEHMEDKTNMPMPEPASGENKQEIIKPMQK
jgi:hypothetical protein